MTGHGAAAVDAAKCRIVAAAVQLMRCAGFSSLLLHLGVSRRHAFYLLNVVRIWREARFAPNSRAQT
jgi:hypothetical protein